MATKKYGMVIDVAKCTGCCNCFLACKDENCNEPHEGYTAAQPMTGQKWLDVKEVERGAFPKVNIRSIPITCMHCDNPGCFKQAQNGAVYKRPDGIVIIDPEKAKGQKDIVNTCPYRRIFWNEALQLPQKCDLCAHLLDKGYAMPRCAELCPTGAITFGDLNDPESEVSRLMEQNPQPIMPQFGLKERVLYLNYPKNLPVRRGRHRHAERRGPGEEADGGQLRRLLVRGSGDEPPLHRHRGDGGLQARLGRDPHAEERESRRHRAGKKVRDVR